MSAQLELPIEISEVGEIRKELSKVKESSDQVRKGIFARYAEFTKNIDAKYSELEKELHELKNFVHRGEKKEFL